MSSRFTPRPPGPAPQLMRPKDKLPRCRSTDPEHRFNTCRTCKMLRQREYRREKGLSPTRPSCVMCGIARGNSSGVPVVRYPLVRYIKAIDSNRCIGSLPLCDTCVADNAKPSRSYIRANGHGFTTVETGRKTA